jgi:hypothetical protein
VRSEEDRAKARAYHKAWRDKHPGALAEYRQKQLAEHPDRVRAYQKKYRDAHKSDRAEYNRGWALKNREQQLKSQRAAHLKQCYGLSQDDYDAMLAAQSSGCAICGKSVADNGKFLAVDHNHTTGKIRGLLCRECNSAIGFMHDNPSFLRLAASYLERTDG